MAHDVQERVLVRLAERHVDAEALGKRCKLLHRIVAVNVIALTVGELLLDDMAAITRRVDCHVLRLRRNGALQHRFQCIEVIVVLEERKVVDEQNKLQRVRRKLIENFRDRL